MSPFHKIAYKKKSTHAAEQILEAIRRGTFRVGDKLPAERELAERMGISRPLVREALSALQIVGILESRPGDGTYVRRAVSAAEANPALCLLEESESLQDAFEARRLLEEGIVTLACRKAEADDLQRLQEALTEMAQAAARKDFEALNRANRRFHLALAQATHNGLLVRALEPLLEVMHQQLPLKVRESFYRDEDRRFAKTFAVHRELVEALVAQDRQRARQLMRRHFDLLEEDLNR